MAEGVKCILKHLYNYRVERLLMGVSGRYEFNLAEAAHIGVPVCIVRPLSVRRCGAINQLAKTDSIDAEVIAVYAAIVQPGVRSRKSKSLIAIEDLIACRPTDESQDPAVEPDQDQGGWSIIY